MNDLLPEASPGQFALAVLPGRAARLLLERAALLALRGPLRVLDGGNCFNAYTVAQSLRRHTGLVNPALERIHLARAFTCYQVLALLEATPGGPFPTLALDLLATFRDENVNLEERRRLLRDAIRHLGRLARQASVLVSVAPLGDGALQDDLLAVLEDAASPVWRLTPPAPPLPLRWF